MKAINKLVIAGAAIGFLFGGANAAAQGLELPEIRDCARQLAFQMRMCANGEQLGATKPKDLVSKKSDQAQGEPSEWSCGLSALYDYFECSGGFGERVNPDVKPPLKAGATQKAASTPTND